MSRSRSRSMRRITLHCIASFSPNTTASGCTRLKSFRQTSGEVRLQTNPERCVFFKQLRRRAFPKNSGKVRFQTNPERCVFKQLRRGAFSNNFGKLHFQTTPERCVLKPLRKGAFSNNSGEVRFQTTPERRILLHEFSSNDRCPSKRAWYRVDFMTSSRWHVRLH